MENLGIIHHITAPVPRFRIKGKVRVIALMSSWATKESGNILFTFDQLVLSRIFNLNTKKQRKESILIWKTYFLFNLKFVFHLGLLQFNLDFLAASESSLCH